MWNNIKFKFKDKQNYFQKQFPEFLNNLQTFY